MLEPTQKDTLHPETKKKPRRDSWRGAMQQNQIPYPSGGQPTNWKIIIPQKFSYRSECSEPCSRLPSLGSLEQEKEPPENQTLKASGFWLQEFHRTGGNKHSTLKGCTQGLVHTRTQGKKQWPHKSLGQTYLLVLEGLLWRWGAAVAYCRDKDTGSSSSGEYSLAWALLEATIFSSRPGPTQQPVGSSAGMLQAKQPQGRNTAPPISRQAA